MDKSQRYWKTILLICIEVLVVWVGNHFGVWYVAFIIGVINGAILTKKRNAFSTAWVSTVSGWGLALL